MRYHVTLTTTHGNKLTMEIKGSETLDSTLRWIERLRASGTCDPVLYWVTTEGKHWCLEPTSLIGEVEVAELQPVGAAAG